MEPRIPVNENHPSQATLTHTWSLPEIPELKTPANPRLRTYFQHQETSEPASPRSGHATFIGEFYTVARYTVFVAKKFL
jgi:hypothetical protein